jgi:hypothetical protein
MDTPTQATLFAKIARVMGQVRMLEKSGTNTYDKYSYMTADDISRRIGSALAAEGVAFFPSIVTSETSEYQTQKGATNFRTVVHMQMTFACSETGAIFTSLWSGEAIDRADKSISKAAVSATKYFLIKTFLLSGGEDDDADGDSPQVEARKAPKPPASYHDDELWEPTSNTPKQPDTLSQAQLTRLHILGADVYGAEWDNKRKSLVEAVTKGAMSSSKELTRDEADILIRGLEKKLKDKQPAGSPLGNGKVAA